MKNLFDVKIELFLRHQYYRWSQMGYIPKDSVPNDPRERVNKMILLILETSNNKAHYNKLFVHGHPVGTSGDSRWYNNG